MTKNPRDYRVWTNREIEDDSEGYVAAQQAFRDDQEATEQQRQGADDEARFKEEFVQAGGRERDAAAAYRTHRNRQAEEAAARSEEAALEGARAHVRQTL
jgi:hypothetical protein